MKFLRSSVIQLLSGNKCDGRKDGQGKNNMFPDEWGRHNYLPECNNNKWIHLTTVYSLTQHVDVPTPIVENTSSAIDHIYSTIPDNICEVQVPTMTISDHYPVYL